MLTVVASKEGVPLNSDCSRTGRSELLSPGLSVRLCPCVENKHLSPPRFILTIRVCVCVKKRIGALLHPHTCCTLSSDSVMWSGGFYPVMLTNTLSRVFCGRSLSEYKEYCARLLWPQRFRGDLGESWEHVKKRL